jgi:L-ascorbate metabolism protein UlaG (beta-lactamase superfamily)
MKRMDLTWYGLSCFRLTERNHATVVTDPYNGHLGLPALKLKADILTISHDAPGHNCLTAVSGYNHALVGPGEYEIGGVFINAVASHPKNNTDKRNIIFVFDYKGLTVAHLGDLNRVPTQAQVDALGQVNILLLPVGGGNTLNAAQAAEVVSMLEPNIVVPMHYALPELNLELDSLERFLKEIGVTEAEPEAMLKVSASTLPEETQVVILTPKLG